jgi:hypothetical protein
MISFDIETVGVSMDAAQWNFIKCLVCNCTDELAIPCCKGKHSSASFTARSLYTCIHCGLTQVEFLELEIQAAKEQRDGEFKQQENHTRQQAEFANRKNQEAQKDKAKQYNPAEYYEVDCNPRISRDDIDKLLGMIRVKKEKVLEEYSKQDDNKDPLFELQKKDYKPNPNADWKIAYDNAGVAKIITPAPEEVARLRDERLKENNINHANAVCR